MKQAMDCKLLWALMALALTACGHSPGKDSEAPEPTASAPKPELPVSPNPAPAPTPTPIPTPVPTPTPAPKAGPAAWSSLPNTSSWTSAVAGVVKANLASFEKAKDRETFCPGYASATLAQRETCWVRLVSAVAKFESNFNPATMYKESDGVYSVGLLQLSTGECANAPTNAALKDPVQNLICGTKKMAQLIARYSYVTTPDNTHGAAAYWSTLRAPYTSGGLHLGKRAEVAKISAAFKAVTPVAVDVNEAELLAMELAAELEN